MQILTFQDVVKVVNLIGLDSLIEQTIARLRFDYSRWQDFHLSKRQAVYHKLGVLELMPCADHDFYSFKYVNGHPNNHELDKLTVTAFGMLAKQVDGYPLMLCDMTLLTAIRTACMTALVVDLADLKGECCLGLVGTGAQAEFLLAAVKKVLPIDKCFFIDKDKNAVEKFVNNAKSLKVNLVEAKSIEEICAKADVIVTATAAKQKQNIISPDWLRAGQLVCGLGGDAPGKTEFSKEFLQKCRVIVEYDVQTKLEGDLQNMPDYNKVFKIADILQKKSLFRENLNEIVFYDSVGFALEDFSILMVLYDFIVKEKNLFNEIDFLPKLSNPKDLFGSLNV